MADRVLLTSLVASGLVAVALIACGGHKTGGSTTPDSPDPLPDGTTARVATGDPPATGVAVTPAAVCARIFELRSSHCPLVDGYDLTSDECVTDYRRSLEERGDDARKATETAGHCLLDNAACEAVSDCFAKLQSDANNGQPETLRACSQTDVYAPVGVSQADFDRRKGANVRRFHDVTSTPAEPIEVCGIPAEPDWLMGPTCDDGSHPFDSPQHAHAARVGNVGAGGRCGSIIDLYEVPCPEGTYAVYIDAYVCPVPAGQPVP